MNIVHFLAIPLVIGVFVFCVYWLGFRRGYLIDGLILFLGCLSQLEYWARRFFAYRWRHRKSFQPWVQWLPDGVLRLVNKRFGFSDPWPND